MTSFPRLNIFEALKLIKNALLHFQKIFIFFSIIEIPMQNSPVIKDVRGRSISPIIIVLKRDQILNRDNYGYGSICDVFLNFRCKQKLSDGKLLTKIIEI